MSTTALAFSISDLTAPFEATKACRSTERDKMTVQTLELDRIYRQYGAMVRRRCLVILKREDDAEDVPLHRELAQVIVLCQGHGFALKRSAARLSAFSLNLPILLRTRDTEHPMISAISWWVISSTSA